MPPADYEAMTQTAGDPLLIPARQAFAAIGCRTTKGYELIHAGLLVAVKSGSRTMITMESLRSYAASLPRLQQRGSPEPRSPFGWAQVAAGEVATRHSKYRSLASTSRPAPPKGAE